MPLVDFYEPREPLASQCPVPLSLQGSEQADEGSTGHSVLVLSQDISTLDPDSGLRYHYPPYFLDTTLNALLPLP